MLSLGTHLEEDSILELEVLPHDVGDVGGLDGEGDGYVRLFQDVVHLMMMKSKFGGWRG